MKKLWEIFDKIIENVNHLFHQYIISSQYNYIEYDRILEITKSTSKTKPSKSDSSRFQKLTQLTKVDHLHQLVPSTWHIFMTAGPDGVAEDKMLTITQSTSKNNISKSKTSRLQNPIQIIKVARRHQLMP